MIEPSSISGAITPVPTMRPSSGSTVPSASLPSTPADTSAGDTAASVPNAHRIARASSSTTAGMANSSSARLRPSTVRKVSQAIVGSSMALITGPPDRRTRSRATRRTGATSNRPDARVLGHPGHSRREPAEVDGLDPQRLLVRVELDAAPRSRRAISADASARSSLERTT